MKVSVVQKDGPLPRPVPYNTLSVGECFLAYGDLFVKLTQDLFVKLTQTGKNTLTFSATEHIWYIGVYTFADDCLVTPVSATLHIEC